MLPSPVSVHLLSLCLRELPGTCRRPPAACCRPPAACYHYYYYLLLLLPPSTTAQSARRREAEARRWAVLREGSGPQVGPPHSPEAFAPSCAHLHLPAHPCISLHSPRSPLTRSKSTERFSYSSHPSMTPHTRPSVHAPTHPSMPPCTHATASIHLCIHTSVHLCIHASIGLGLGVCAYMHACRHTFIHHACLCIRTFRSQPLSGPQQHKQQ